MTALATPRQLTLGAAAGSDAADGAFHPAVAEWFRRRFPDGPTPPQAEGWVHIAAGADALITAPTGSGQDLHAFFMHIDHLFQDHDGAARR